MFLKNALVTVGSKLKREMSFMLLSTVLLAVVANLVNETFFVGTATAIFAAKIYLDMSRAVMSEAARIID